MSSSLPLAAVLLALVALQGCSATPTPKSAAAEREAPRATFAAAVPTDWSQWMPAEQVEMSFAARSATAAKPRSGAPKNDGLKPTLATRKK